MLKKISVTLALASAQVLHVVPSNAGEFAAAVTEYQRGTGFSPGFTNATAALGEPSRITPGQFGGPVDPFNPPYLPEQLVSVGAGGLITLQFNSAVRNDPANPFGVDFIIFGNSGFIITNGDFGGGGVTDGSLFAANAGETRVSVSSDGVAFYELAPSLAPVVDGPFPTDGNGNFFVPVNPALNKSSFAGKDLAGIRQLYARSAGGTGYDIAWARDSQGQPINLGSIQYLRINVLSGASEIDAVTAVPEPATGILLLTGCAAILALKRRSRAGA
jgi:hypothetical protein